MPAQADPVSAMLGIAATGALPLISAVERGLPLAALDRMAHALASNRSLLLLVPSLVARMECNVLINGRHRDAARLSPSLHQPVWCDRRLFPAPVAPAR